MTERFRPLASVRFWLKVDVPSAQCHLDPAERSALTHWPGFRAIAHEGSGAAQRPWLELAAVR